MARGTSELTQVLEGALWATGLVLGVEAYRHYRARGHEFPHADPEVVCAKCGETQPISEFMNPSVTCSCVASSDCSDPRMG